MRIWPIGLCLALLAIPAWAQKPAPRNPDQAQQKLEAVRSQIHELSAEQRQLAEARARATRSLRDADSQVSKAARALHDTEAAIAAQEAQIRRNEERKLSLESGLIRQKAELARLLRSAYALGNHEQLKLLLEQDRMSDLARVLAYHRYFQAERQQRIVGLRGELQALAEVSQQLTIQRQALDGQRAEQQAQLATLQGKRVARDQQVAVLDSQYQDRKTRLAALGRDEKALGRLLAQLRATAARAAAQAARPTPGPTRTTPVRPGDAAIPRGPLNLPLTGTILAGFGGTLPDGHRSDGLWIAGAAGAEVHAVAAGKVAYADWLKGYGLLLIIDHGGGLMTLYAYNDALLKSVGEPVRAGEAIATVGRSGGQPQPALYFELRRNGQPQDPAGWLRH